MTATILADCSSDNLMLPIQQQPSQSASASNGEHNGSSSKPDDRSAGSVYLSGRYSIYYGNYVEDVLTSFRICIR
ncbi:hypothetical protein [uncultured Bacteroides sp.]|uniref:hypothetical protein n=1 Tax=uncultured Bacteroides sp. TaxID=162156 RepID=UPI0025FEDB0A|nr:hypothetical protein [uncultured Bacteroides sp.]